VTRKRTKKKRTPPTLVDIVIPVYNRFDLLAECLLSIPEAMGDVTYRIIIFDNGSIEEEERGFYEIMMSKNEMSGVRQHTEYGGIKVTQYPTNNVIVIRNANNIGFPMGCNTGAKRGRSPLIFFLNSDVILEPDSVNKLVKVMDDPKVGVAGMKLVFPDDLAGLNEQIRPSGKLQHIGLSVNIRGEVHHPFIAWRPDHPRVEMQREVFAVTGAALMTRRSIWVEAGGFYEGYGMGTYEDVDYCVTVREMGYNILIEPKACGVHYVGATAEKYNIGYNLGYNHMIFRQRWAQKIEWWDYKIL